MTNLDMLLLKGPSSGNIEEGLGELRYTILTQGIPANSEGMVGSPPLRDMSSSMRPTQQLLAMISRLANIQ